MNINYFFLFISFCLIMILFLFKPLEIKQRPFTEVPLFSISFFTMYELNSKKLITLMNGDEATRYSNRYTVEKMDYTDNSKKYIANMKSNSGIYKDDIVYLDGDVSYFRQDGLTFETQNAVYNKKTSIAVADKEFVIYRDENKVTGKELMYNNSLEKIKARDVKAVYKFKESNR